MTPHSTTEAQAERSAETRGRILDAALSEFAANGLAGARTEHIAVAAGVNKALALLLLREQGKVVFRGAGDGGGACTRSLDGGFPA